MSHRSVLAALGFGLLILAAPQVRAEPVSGAPCAVAEGLAKAVVAPFVPDTTADLHNLAAAWPRAPA